MGIKGILSSVLKRNIIIFKNYIIDQSPFYGDIEKVEETDDYISFYIKIRKRFIPYKEKHEVVLEAINKYNKINVEGKLHKIFDQYYIYQFEISNDISKSIKLYIKAGNKRYRIRKKK